MVNNAILKVNKIEVTMIFSAILSVIVYLLTKNANVGFFVAFVGVMIAFSLCIFFHKKEKHLMTILFVLGCDFFGIVPMLSIGSGLLHWYDINAVFSVIVFLKYINISYKSKYGIFFISCFVFIIIACCQSYNIYNQNVIVTIASARSMFSIFCFWPLVGLIKLNSKYAEIILNRFLFVVKLAIIIYCVQWILVNIGIDATFLQTKTRWGTRLYFDNFLLVPFYYYYLYDVIYTKERFKFDSAKWCVMVLLTFTVIGQMRSAAFFMFLVSIIILFLSLKISSIIKYSVISFIAIILLLSIPFVRESVNSAFLELSSGESGSIAFRVVEQSYYEGLLKGHKLFGVGIPNNHLAESIKYSGMFLDFSKAKYSYYFLDDLGAFKIEYQFGLIAYCMYFLFLSMVLIKNLFRKKKTQIGIAVAGTVLFFLMDYKMLECLTRQPFLFVFIIVLAEISNIEGKIEGVEYGKQLSC